MCTCTLPASLVCDAARIKCHKRGLSHEQTQPHCMQRTVLKNFSELVSPSAGLSNASFSRSCSGSSTPSMPSTSHSPKYSRLASSRASCHCSCHRMAMRMSSSDTSFVCATRFGEWL